PNDGYLSSAISDGSLVVAFFVCLLKDSIAPYFITGFFTARNYLSANILIVALPAASRRGAASSHSSKLGVLTASGVKVVLFGTRGSAFAIETTSTAAIFVP